MKRIRDLLLYLAAGVLCTGAAAKSIEALSPHWNFQSPNSGEKSPLVVLIPGCSGFRHEATKAHYDTVQKQLNDAGYATVRVDPHAARGTDTCQGLYSGDVAADVKTAVDEFKKSPMVDASKVTLLGWSWGAKIALQSLALLEKDALYSVVSYYPNCEWMSPWATKANVALLYGSEDKLSPPQGCKSMFESSTKGSSSRFEVFDGAVHLFDFENLEKPVNLHGHNMVYQKDAAEAAWKVVLKLLPPTHN